MSSENGPHSNVIKIFQLDRSEAQMFCVSFNNLTVLTGLAMLMESAIYIYFYSNLFGIVEQTAKRSKIAVHCQFFNLSLQMQCQNFNLALQMQCQIFNLSLQMQCQNFNLALQMQCQIFNLTLQMQCQIFNLSLQLQCQIFKLPICHCKCSANLQ